MDDKRIAIVTGANRGIGFEICRQLAHAGFHVILAARDPEKGTLAAAQLAGEGLSVEFLPLEVGNEISTHEFAGVVKNKFSKIDVLVNNAGLLPNSAGISSVEIQELKQVFDTNVFGPVILIQDLLPLLKASKDARVINISSRMGAINSLGSSHLAYRSSKTALNAITKIIAGDLAGTNIKINSMCPGWVRTDMGGKGAPRTVQQGADTAVWLATAQDIPNGRFFADRKEIPW